MLSLVTRPFARRKKISSVLLGESSYAILHPEGKTDRRTSRQTLMDTVESVAFPASHAATLRRNLNRLQLRTISKKTFFSKLE